MSDRRKTGNAAFSANDGPITSDLRMSIINAKIALQTGDVESGTMHLNNALKLTEVVNGLETNLPIFHIPTTRKARRMKARR